MDLASYTLDTLHQDGDFVLCRGRAAAAGSGGPPSVLVLLPRSEHPGPELIRMLSHELRLQTELDAAWAVRPFALVQHQGRAALILEDPLGEPLDVILETQVVNRSMGVARSAEPALPLDLFLRLATGLAAALGEVHRRGLVHKNVKPANVVVNVAMGQVWLTGFGIASRLPRERQAPGPPETIAGTLAYMAPEQTGRMNRSIDARSDLYSLGITLYQMLTGSLPWSATDPMEWVHCHVARPPQTPAARVENVPARVSAIILKLLAKTAEDRYQTATGLDHDLRACLAQWETLGRIDDLPLGEHDTPDRLLVPEKLYGRAREIELLLAAFERVVKGGAPELVLVSGYSGIGKSSVVNELHRALVPPRGVFAAGKFDQFRRDIPYATLAQAFQSLVRPMLSKSEAELGDFREALREALGPNARLMADLVPELELVLGAQPPVPELPPLDAQRRFQLVFRRFLGVFARADQPLALFLDDLQWLDAATLDLLEDLLTEPDLRHVLLIGAYRDNEVASTHPLLRTLSAIRSAGAFVQEIVLDRLTGEDVSRLVADSLYCDLERAAPLSQLVQEKTDGNPFFVIQFLTTLVDEGLVTFNHGATQWRWDLTRIHAKGYTDNVVDIMVDKLRRLPSKAKWALQGLACLGNGAEPAALAMIHEASRETLHDDLLEALKSGLVLHSEGSYRFLHDRVHEAAYSLIPEAERPKVHLRIGRLLVAHTPLAKREEAIFEIVNQLNRSAVLITQPAEREELAQANLTAGKRAKASAAYASALAYFTAGGRFLAGGSWETCYRLEFELELHRAECEILTGERSAAEARLSVLAGKTQNIVDGAAVACLRVDLYTNLDQAERAAEIGREFLRAVGMACSAHPTNDEVGEECELIWRNLGGRSVEELLDLDSMSDTSCRATLDVLTSLQAPAHFVDANLPSMLVARMVNLSLVHGNAPGSCYAYGYFGMILEGRFDDYARGLRFGKLAVDLVEKPGFDRYRARTYNNFAVAINPWANHVRTSVHLLRHANDAAREAGDLTFVGYSYTNLISALLVAGDSLADVQAEAEAAVASLQRARFGTAVDMVLPQLGLVRALRGLTADLSTFDHLDFDEGRFERHLEEVPGLWMPACWYWIRRTQACYFAGDYASAVDAANRADCLLWTSPTFIPMADYHFYAALARTAHYAEAPADARASIFAGLEVHRKLLAIWAETCPDTFANRAALVEAEVARVEGRLLDAMQLYERAMLSAREQGFVQNEALANELAAEFYAARGFEKIAHAYLRDAEYCYLRWGAEGKVRRLQDRYPHLRRENATPGSTRTIATPVEHLDLATVIKVSQTIAGEVILEKLLDTLLRSAIEHAGAERAVLVLAREGEQRIVAEAVTHIDAVLVQLLDRPVTASVLPETMFRCVLQTQESVLLDDAALPHSFSSDPYLRQRRARSVLCLPLSNQAKLIGVLYLENNLASRVFVPARAAALKLLASQAAISLENTRLYRDLAAREAKIRRLVDANIIGIFIWELDGGILEANDAFLDMVGYDRDDLLAGRLQWTAMTPPEWRARDERFLPELKVRGSLQPFEKEYFRKDGSRVPVLVGVATFEEDGNQGVAYVLDLTERNRAQEALTRAGAELAHVSRVTALGALTASIAHEVNQPLSGIITNASTCLRMLDAPVPNLDGARETVQRLLRDGKRAADVIQRLRALFSKREFTLEQLDLNEATGEVVALSANDFYKNRIILRSELADDLPLVIGDRVQLQQVILNLLRNAADAMVDVHDRPRHLLVKTALEDGDRLRLTVRDVGVGLPAQSVDSLFEAFRSTKSNGMGIGLFVSRSIIERHQGGLWAQPNEGPGATFAFSIPRDPRSGA